MTRPEMEPFFYRAPADLRARIRGEMHEAKHPKDDRVRPAARLFYVAIGLAWAASLLVVSRFSTLETRESPLVEEVIASHVRSMMAEHLTDVASSDRHTVKPWFSGKLDFAPQVADLAADGFPLVGGRLDYIANRPVAALVYQRQQHVINLFTWPSAESTARAPRLITHQGYQIFEWVKGGMQYWLISDLNAAELQTLAQRIDA